MRSHSVDRPADLDVVRESYDRVADTYAHMVATTGMGDIRRHPWLTASMDAFADSVRGLGPSSTSAAAPVRSPPTSPNAAWTSPGWISRPA